MNAAFFGRFCDDRFRKIQFFRSLFGILIRKLPHFLDDIFDSRFIRPVARPPFDILPCAFQRRFMIRQSQILLSCRFYKLCFLN